MHGVNCCCPATAAQNVSTAADAPSVATIGSAVPAQVATGSAAVAQQHRAATAATRIEPVRSNIGGQCSPDGVARTSLDLGTHGEVCEEGLVAESPAFRRRKSPNWRETSGETARSPSDFPSRVEPEAEPPASHRRSVPQPGHDDPIDANALWELTNWTSQFKPLLACSDAKGLQHLGQVPVQPSPCDPVEESSLLLLAAHMIDDAESGRGPVLGRRHGNPIELRQPSCEDPIDAEALQSLDAMDLSI